jgi:hypothetical protein
MKRGTRLVGSAAILQLLSFAYGFSGEQLWFWYSRCGGPTMVLEVTLDQKPILRALIPVCHAERTTTLTRNQAHVLRKRFKPTRDIDWVLFRKEPERTTSEQELQLSISQPEAVPDAVAIDVVVSMRDRVYMAAVIAAHPDRRDETEIAEGLVVATYPHGPDTTTKDR